MRGKTLTLRMPTAARLQVKWRGLEYEECTWEMEGDLVDHMHLVQAFLDREKDGERASWGFGWLSPCFSLFFSPLSPSSLLSAQDER